jgi:hypothetical protein
VTLHDATCTPLVLLAIALLTLVVRLNACLLQQTKAAVSDAILHQRLHHVVVQAPAVCYCSAGCYMAVVLFQQSAQPFKMLSAAATQVPLCSQYKTPGRSS